MAGGTGRAGCLAARTPLALACALSAAFSLAAAEDASCAEWAAAGECASNPRFMLSACRQACAAAASGAAAAPGQRDLEPECGGYARMGECARNPAFMLSRCKPSCTAWERANGITLDRRSECVDETLKGRCIEEPASMGVACNASCEIAAKCQRQTVVSLGICDKALRCEAVDLDADCAQRAARGECASRAVAMARRCLLTCSRADVEAVMRTHLPDGPVIISPLIDLPAPDVRRLERCGLSPYMHKLNHYKLHFPDRCYVADARARHGARGGTAPWRPRPRADVRAASRAGYVTAHDAPDPCPYDWARITPRVPGTARVLAPMGEWHTTHSVRLVHVLPSPRIRLLRDFLAEGEAEAIIALAESRFHASPVRSVATSKRTSSSASLPADDEVVRRVRARVAHFSGYPLSSLEIMQVVRYEPGQRYEPHHDIFDVCDFEQRPRRHITFLIYLSDLPDGAGGDTTLPRMHLSVRPTKNTALVFNNVLDDGYEDERTEHAGTAPTAGVKYAINQWIRAPSGGEAGHVAQRQWRDPTELRAEMGGSDGSGHDETEEADASLETPFASGQYVTLPALAMCGAALVLAAALARALRRGDAGRRPAGRAKRTGKSLR